MGLRIFVIETNADLSEKEIAQALIKKMGEKDEEIEQYGPALKGVVLKIDGHHSF